MVSLHNGTVLQSHLIHTDCANLLPGFAALLCKNHLAAPSLLALGLSQVTDILEGCILHQRILQDHHPTLVVHSINATLLQPWKVQNTAALCVAHIAVCWTDNTADFHFLWHWLLIWEEYSKCNAGEMLHIPSWIGISRPWPCWW